jgi:hypothetical protein
MASPVKHPSQELDDSFSEQETARRRETALKRMLATPHKPHKPIGKRTASPEMLTTGKGRARVGKAKR